MSGRSKTELEAKLKAIESYSQGAETIARIGAELKVHLVTVRRWKERYEGLGFDGIRDHPKNGIHQKKNKISVVERCLRGKRKPQEIYASREIYVQQGDFTMAFPYPNRRELRPN